MHTSQCVNICFVFLCATACSAFVMKGESARLHSNRMSPLMEQEPAFNRDCKAFPNKRIIVVTPNVEYWDMFLNWVHHAKVYMGEHDQLVVIAQDEDIVTRLQKRSFVFVDLDGTLNIPADALDAMPAKIAGPYGSAEFSTLVGKRPANLLFFLKLNCTVLYSDIDNVWIGDVFQDIAEAGAHDLYITDDNPANSSLTTANQWNFCTCFLYMQPTAPVLELMQNWANAASGHVNQPPFNDALRSDYAARQLVDFAVLPFGAFPPGIVADRFWGTPGVHVLHANWRKGIDAKTKFLVDHGVWTQ